jgi:hypothetical protein
VISCPAAPPGWHINPGDNTGQVGVATGGRTVWTPLSSAGDARLGGNAVQVACDYFTNDQNRLTVLVDYALPRDPNPWWDFDIGCSSNDFKAALPTGAYAWNTRDRVYREVSLDRWSFAMFNDFYHGLPDRDVAAFQAVAHSLLKSSEPTAHDCSGSGVPVALKTTWSFGFAVRVTSDGSTAGGGTTGTFVITPSTTGGNGVISRLRASDIVLKMTPKGAKQAQSITIRVGDPIDFQSRYGSTLRAAIAVVTSSYAPCRPGMSGRLTVSTESSPAVAVRICGTNLVQGEGQIALHLETV